jgi:hypothetical protein
MVCCSRSIIAISIAKIKVYLVIPILFTAILLLVSIAALDIFCWLFFLYLGWCCRFDGDLWDRCLLRGSVIISIPEVLLAWCSIDVIIRSNASSTLK